MGKHSELCQSFREHRDELSQFRLESHQFGQKLGAGYISYLDVPEGDFSWHKTNEFTDQNKNYTILGAMKLEDDGFWSLGVSILIYITKNTFPQSKLLINFYFKEKTTGTYTVKISTDDNSPSTVNIDNNNDFTIVYDRLQELIIKMYKNTVKNIKEDNSKLPTIGFVQSVNVTEQTEKS